MSKKQENIVSVSQLYDKKQVYKCYSYTKKINGYIYTNWIGKAISVLFSGVRYKSIKIFKTH